LQQLQAYWKSVKENPEDHEIHELDAAYLQQLEDDGM
jgi:hypothetical protein